MQKPIAAVVIVLVALLPAAAHAQEVVDFDVSGSYSVSHNDGRVEILHGGVVSSAAYPTPWFGLVLEAGLGRRILSFGVGPRVVFPTARSITPFAQVLFGVASADNDVIGGGSSFGVLAYQPGGGVDVWIRRNMAFRVGLDYLVPETDHRYNKLRYQAGVVFRRRPR